MSIEELCDRWEARDAAHDAQACRAEVKHDLLCSIALNARPPFVSREEAADMVKLAFLWALPLTRSCAGWAHDRYAHDPPRQRFLEKLMRTAEALWGEGWARVGLARDADWEAWMDSV